MIRSQLILDIHDELIVDNFAGGGGASCGIEMALGRHVDHAINHDRHALGMHRINHPQTVHHCEDIFDIDPAVMCGGHPIGLAHFSPDCKHFSKAKGGQPLDKRIRGLVLVMLRYAKYGARVMTMENVEEIKTWGPLKRILKNGAWGMYPDPEHRGRTWQAFLAILGPGIAADHPDLPEILEVLAGTLTHDECVHGFGYQFETREIRACDLGTPTIRKRLYLIARNDWKPIVWPEPSHYDPASGQRAQGRKPWRAIAECIDWTLACPSIFLTKQEARASRCKRPLAKATLRRAARGIDRYVLKAARPFLVSLTHQGGDRIESIDEPAKTLTAAHRGEKALVAPVLTEHANATNARSFAANEPLRTQCAEVKGGHFAMIGASLAQTGYGEREGQAPRALDPGQPLGTVVAGGAKHAVVTGTLVHTAHGEQDSKGKKRGRGARDVTEPMPSVLASPDGAIATGTLVGAGGPAYSGKPKPVDAPMNAQTTENHAAVVAASMVKLRGDNIGDSVDQPSHTISAGGTHHGVIAASLAVQTTGHSGSTPSEIEAQAVRPMTEAQIAGAHRVAAFLREHGVQFEGEFATVAGYVIVDIGMRMLTPRELFRAQGFPEEYVIDRAWVVDPTTGEIVEIRLTKEQQIRMVGNSVCRQVLAAIVAVNVPELSVRFEKDKGMVAL